MKSKSKKIKYFRSSTFFLGITIVFIIVLIGGIRYVCYEKEVSSMPIHSVDTNDKEIALTFDVAWGTNNIDEILQVLEKHNVKSTFFLVGSWIEDNEELVEKIHNAGHEIGNHSNTHASFKNLSKESKAQEIKLVSEKIYDITGEKISLFRPPFGDTDKETLEVSNSLGHQAIKWSLDSMDWKGFGANHVIDRVMKNSEPGSIVLFHSNVSNVENYIDTIIFNLKKDGYKIVPVSEITYKENFKVDSNGVQKLQNK
ncbi:polysaccharide deacetylase family protein [Romboutsia sp. 1001713B170131_170501_G6]|uniref:polysaccharide deacetylase family protein n=1 Tax=Romboutsia sp. 1001713B170131_170501_G6 TaxID=2787108 RepID=UPI0018AB6B91|nr:polysaccharide deacetylase family protein [Romboutsia sp. 1001713B170131_170501_G6]